MSAEKTTPVEFTGKTSEYFGIWIVNLLLSIVTLGIYSAWAKVRRKKYFYNNTLIDNVGFDYHANPIAILKGRIIALVFLVIYQVGGRMSPSIAVICFIILMIFLPWIVVRSATFNARNTSHRGLRFDFVGKTAQAAYVFILLPLITAITLGLALPYFMQQKNKFLADHHRFGLSQFNISATVGQFYRIYWLPVLLYLLMISAAIGIPAYMAYQAKAKAAQHSQISVPFSMGFADTSKTVVAANEVVTPIERVYSENGPDPESAPTAPMAEPAVPAQAGAEATADAMSQEEMAQRKLEEISKLPPAEQEKALAAWMAEQQEAGMAGADGEMEGMEGMEGEEADEKTPEEKMAENIMKNPMMGFYVVVGILAFYAFAFMLMAYIQARSGNLVWNSTKIDNLSFKSSLRARDFAWLYLSNLLAIAFTFGLATPWAQVRMARYRASKLAIVGDVDFDQFVGDKKAKMAAAGEEIADFFDVDLSFG